MDVAAYNREAWARAVARGNVWTRPVAREVVDRARRGQASILLTATRPVPTEWLAGVADADVLCLAGGGGQQGPILAAMGARVTVFDNSPAQLATDQMVAERDGLALTTVQGDMRDLSTFDDASFDIVIHPLSNCFVDKIQPTWDECYRVLRFGGALLAGFNNPLLYLLDRTAWRQHGRLEVRYRLPYADSIDLSAEELERHIGEGRALEFGHTLTAQIGGQIAAGFVITGFYEDNDGGGDLLDGHADRYIATRAAKQRRDSYAGAAAP